MVLRIPPRPVEQSGTSQKGTGGAWWAVGDAPVRTATMTAALVDGRAAMLAMCVAFLTAKQSIHLADWGIFAPLRMVRGRDHRAGPDGSEEQYALLDRLRAAGLDAEAIRFWEASPLRVVDVLAFAVRRGVDVRVLLWGPFNPWGMVHIVNNPNQQRRELEARGITCRLDKNSRSPLHVAQALHQKCAIVDGATAFVGGVDLTVEPDGDYDRWDTPAHPYSSSLRSTELGPAPHPWHDAHVMLTGDPAADVLRNFDQRWHGAAQPLWHRIFPPVRALAAEWLRGHFDGYRALRRAERGEEPPGAGPQVSGPAMRVQVVRTIPALTYRFAPQGIHTIAQAYILAARHAQRFIYLESQYLWLEGFEGINMWRLGWQSRAMRALLDELAAAAERGVTIAFVLPDHPNAGRPYTDDTIKWLRDRAPTATAANRLRFYTLATSAPDPRGGPMRYKPIYVHAKVGIVDDAWATAGSANLNSRGVSHDAELNVAVLDDGFARALRLMLWAEHAGAMHHDTTGWPAPAALPLPRPLIPPRPEGVAALLRDGLPWPEPHPADEHSASAAPAEGDLETLSDPLAGLDLLARRADENLRRLRSGERLVGQLLPYLRAGEGAELGLHVERETGFLDPLEAKRAGVPVYHPARYT